LRHEIRSAVQGAADAVGAAVRDVSVDHRGGDVLVAAEFLHGADVVTVLEEVRGEAVAQGMGGDDLGDVRREGSAGEGALNDGSCR
jgi:hypothetical protein